MTDRQHLESGKKVIISFVKYNIWVKENLEIVYIKKLLGDKKFLHSVKKSFQLHIFPEIIKIVNSMNLQFTIIS